MPYISDMALPPALVPAIKRKRTEDEISPSSPDTPNPVKRPRVSFSPTAKIRYLEDANEKPLSLVREEVRQALARHRRNDDVEYHNLKELFTKNPYDDEAPSNTSLQQHIIALSGQVLSLADNSGDLVYAMLDCKWLQRDDDFVTEFRHFLAILLTTYNGYLPLVLKWLVGNFVGGL
jgi:RNA polymerase I-specific transcription initiation factor RRN3